jgi:hypothetical protein
MDSESLGEPQTTDVEPPSTGSQSEHFASQARDNRTRQDALRDLYQRVGDLAVYQSSPRESRIWVTSVQHVANQTVIEAQPMREAALEVTATFYAARDLNDMAFVVDLSADGRRLRFRPVIDDLATAVEMERSPSALVASRVCWRLFSDLSQDLELDDVEAVIGSRTYTSESYRRLYDEAELVSRRVYPFIFKDRPQAIVLQSGENVVGNADTRRYTASDELTKATTDVYLPSDVPMTDFARQRASLAVAFTIDANRRTRFREPITSIAFGSVSDRSSDNNPFATVAERAVSRWKTQRTLHIDSGFLDPEAEARTSALVRRHQRQGFLVQGEDAMLVGAAHAIADVAVRDAGVRLRGGVSRTYGAIAAASVLSQTVDGVPLVVSGLGALYGAIGAITSRRSDPLDRLAEQVQFQLLKYNVRTGSTHPDGVVSLKSALSAAGLSIFKTDDRRIDVLTKLAAYGYLREFVSGPIAKMLDPIMNRPQPTIEWIPVDLLNMDVSDNQSDLPK